MIAASRYRQPARRGDRLLALLLVALVHVGLGLALIGGLKVRLEPGAASPLALIELSLPQPPPPPPPPILQTQERSGSAAARATPKPKGGVEAPSLVKQLAPVPPPPIIALPVPSLPAAGGIEGRGGPSAGAGAGGGQGGDGSGNGSGDGEGDGGTGLEQIGGSIRSSDYPRQLRNRGTGGLVEVRFTVAPNGRVSRCEVTRSSGVIELDDLTCRLIQQRFVFRPSTDRSGRAVASEVEGDHLWEARPNRD